MSAIYVGEPNPFHPLRYGMTGQWEGGFLGIHLFKPHGKGQHTWLIDREDVYIPALDATRYCPSPQKGGQP